MDVPQAIVKPSAKDPVASSIDLTGALFAGGRHHAGGRQTGTGIAVTATASVFVAGDVGKQLYADSGVATITAQTGTGATVDITSDFASATYARGGYGITDSAWRSDDVGKFVRINGGSVQDHQLHQRQRGQGHRAAGADRHRGGPAAGLVAESVGLVGGQRLPAHAHAARAAPRGGWLCQVPCRPFGQPHRRLSDFTRARPTTTLTSSPSRPMR